MESYRHFSASGDGCDAVVRPGHSSGGEGGTTPALRGLGIAGLTPLSTSPMTFLSRRKLAALANQAGSIAARLSPIVKNVQPRATVTRLVRSVHRHALDHRAEAARHHLPVGFLAREIDPGQNIRHAGVVRERSAGVEQCAEPLLSAGSRPHRCEFRKVAAFAGFARRAKMTNGTARKSAVLVPQ